MASLPPPGPPSAGGDPLAATIPPSLPSPAPSSSSLNLSPSLLIITALLAFVFFASVSIHFLLRCLARPSSSSHPAPSPLPRGAPQRAPSSSVEAEEANASDFIVKRTKIQLQPVQRLQIDRQFVTATIIFYPATATKHRLVYCPPKEEAPSAWH
uniref:Uncharacterized protein n=1 Tax=Oryza brachyantha TaxID=4533 RepID=J3LFZ4_ORYBR